MINIDQIADRLVKRIDNLKRNWIFIILLGIPSIVLVAYFFVKISFSRANLQDNDVENYHKIEYNDAIVGVIDSVYSYRGLSMVTLKDSTKIWFAFSENDMYTKYLLCDFLMKNDSLIKRRDCDTLFVFRNGNQYYFWFDGLKTSSIP